MELTTPVGSFIGGVLIGLAVVMLYVFSGRIAGISGIVADSMTRASGRLWRLIFLAGLLIGGCIVRLLSHDGWHFEDTTSETPLIVIIIGGLLVGIGTRLSNGCTSGHGVCGNARLSRRSMVATATFVFAGMMIVAIARTGMALI